MPSFKDRLKEILLRDRLIAPDELDNALQEQNEVGGELSKILVRRRLIDEATLAQILSESLGLPQIQIARYKIDPQILQIIPKDVAVKNKIVPLSLLGNHLTVALADPLNILVGDAVKALTGYQINPVIAKPSEIEAAIQKHYAGEGPEQKVVEEPDETFDEIIKDIQDTEDLELVGDAKAAFSKVEEVTDDAPIIKLTDTIIQQAVYAKASDVFIEPMEKTVRIRYRVDGVIREIDRLPQVVLFPLISRIKVISNLDISEHRLPQDGRFKTVIAGNRTVDFRVNILPTALGEKACLRVLDKAGTVLNVEKLGFEPTALARLKECAARPHGMILTCGPTGSGKTTTLYSILKYIDSPGKNLVTVEDPVEYQMKGMNQVNVKPAMGLTFSSSLRSILRQDPNVILIGEIRDAETLDIAVKAALTGHLVLSSLHTTTAAGSVVRMMNMGIEPFLICSSVLAIVAQRLIRKICPDCHEKYELPDAVAERVGLKRLYPDRKTFELLRAKGCKTCFQMGYKGRVGITEILVLSPLLKEKILSRAGEVAIKNFARKEGMRTMREDALSKAVEGLTTLEEVLRITAQDEELRKS
jgi:type IV pilus assembly protein PilB